jgi:hypothetical protein
VPWVFVRKRTSSNKVFTVHRLRMRVITWIERPARHLMSFPSNLVRSFALLLGALALGTQPLAVVPIAGPSPAQLKSAALEAFNHYVRLTEVRNEAELKRGVGLLWIDGLPETERRRGYEELRRGAMKMRKLETLDNGAAIDCPSGMIHHWVGLAFIPGVKLRDVLEVLQDYNQHAVYYAPDVERSKIERRDGDHFRVFLRFRRKKVVTVVLNTEHDVQYFRDLETRAHSRSSAVRIAQVENAGKSDEREDTPGDDDGFLWRMETWWQMVEGDGGVYVQSEVASLTRNIPAGLAWLIGPFVTSIPEESLAFTLEATRKAVATRHHN